MCICLPSSQNHFSPQGKKPKNETYDLISVTDSRKSKSLMSRLICGSSKVIVFNFSFISPGNLCDVYSMHEPSLFNVFMDYFIELTFFMVAGRFYFVPSNIHGLHCAFQSLYLSSKSLRNIHACLYYPKKNIIYNDIFCCTLFTIQKIDHFHIFTHESLMFFGLTFAKLKGWPCFLSFILRKNQS